MSRIIDLWFSFQKMKDVSSCSYSFLEVGSKAHCVGYWHCAHKQCLSYSIWWESKTAYENYNLILKTHFFSIVVFLTFLLVHLITRGISFSKYFAVGDINFSHESVHNMPWVIRVAINHLPIMDWFWTELPYIKFHEEIWKCWKIFKSLIMFLSEVTFVMKSKPKLKGLDKCGCRAIILIQSLTLYALLIILFIYENQDDE